MELKSLGYKSQLIFTDFDGLSADRSDHFAIHTLTNPNYFWGNLLIFERPPVKGDYEKWTNLFRKEFQNPKIYHTTLAWQNPNNEIADFTEFLEKDFIFESTEVLTASKVIRPPKFNDLLEVRHFRSSTEWEASIQIQIASSHHEHLTRAEWESFYRNQSLRYQTMEKAGLGHWYGGFLNGKLVASLGLFHGHGIGRFQTVSTDPNYQRQGFCQTLVYKASIIALATNQIQNLVMCADPSYHAIRIYESLGFQRQQTEQGVYWWDKTRSPSSSI